MKQEYIYTKRFFYLRCEQTLVAEERESGWHYSATAVWWWGTSLLFSSSIEGEKAQRLFEKEEATYLSTVAGTRRYEKALREALKRYE